MGSAAKRLRRLALAVSRSRIGVGFASWAVRWVPALVPGRLVTVPELLIISHPAPIAPDHLLAVSRHGTPDLLTDDSQSRAFWSRLAECWTTFDGVAVGISNLGRRQDVRLLHVHLLPQRPDWAAGESTAAGESIATVLQSLRSSETPRLHGCTASIAIAPDGTCGWRAWVDLVS